MCQSVRDRSNLAFPRQSWYLMAMSRPINILFEAAGRRVSLVRAFKRALEAAGMPGKTIAANSDRRAAAL